MSHSLREEWAEVCDERDKLKAENTRLHTGEGHAGCDVQTCEIAAVASDESSEVAEALAANTPLQEERRVLLWAFRKAAGALDRTTDALRYSAPALTHEYIAGCATLKLLAGHDGLQVILGKQPEGAPAVTGTTSDKAPIRKPAAGDAKGK